MENFLLEYRNLELRVMCELRNKIENSKYLSEHTNEKAIKVNVFNYKELTLVSDRLTFVDSCGMHYSLLSDCNLEDLIEILNN